MKDNGQTSGHLPCTYSLFLILVVVVAVVVLLLCFIMFNNYVLFYVLLFMLHSDQPTATQPHAQQIVMCHVLKPFFFSIFWYSSSSVASHHTA